MSRPSLVTTCTLHAAYGGVPFETWFSILSCRATDGGVFTSVQALIDAIQRFLDGWNERCKPFVWVKSAEQILARLNRQPSRETVH